VVKFFLDCGADINALTRDGQSALLKASQIHNLSIAKLLLEHGADVNLTTQPGNTPLFYALQKPGGEEIAKVLLAYGAEVNIQGPFQTTPLTMAIVQNNRTLVELLLDHGATEELV